MEAEQQSEITLVDHDGFSGFFEYETMVVRDSKSLAKFYAQVNKTRKPGLPVPQIDFSKETVIIVCSGEQKGEMETKLMYKEETDNELVINVEMQKPEKGSATGNSVVSYPFYLYKIPHTSKSVVIQRP
ncbi:hypothetical protein [Flagellimonas allohymeniacidonis]|uniref:PrcB C-terminal domain-containing protein n=1 Tax=Flagellimonas allohymeniacidonis TaxID=2517819 RepID=A0A4Q8QIL4_9FLAO|nr:hypothetical protein [Allomuricauda hymeniacidonis]TAI48553.1 hypothetical protein EW142_01755 [Allomuricauda hymeniacidonis]